MDDSTEVEGRPGDTEVIPPGHDSWVVGDEPCIMIDFTEMKDFAKKEQRNLKHQLDFWPNSPKISLQSYF